MESFATRLRTAMNARHLRQVDIVRAAQASGVKLGKSHISQYVSGKTTPRADTLRFLADTLQVDEQWLLGHDRGRPDMPAQPKRVPDNPGGRADSPRTPSPQTPSSQASAPQTTSPSHEPEGTPMRHFNKSTKLDNVLYDVRGPVVDEAARMEQSGMHVLKLNIGNPAPFGFRTPDEVVYDMSRQLSDTEGYSASKGLFSARKAIMQYAQLKNLPNVGIEDIYTGNGVSELINLSLSALLDNGDEVLVPSPDYPLWTACVNLAGGTAVHYICDEKSGWLPDLDDMRKKVTPRTKAIVVINPNNPTGVVYPREILEGIVKIAREFDLILYADEIYDRLVMDGIEHVALASLAPDLLTVSFNGLSKSHLMAGYRVGWMCLAGDKRRYKGYIEGINLLSAMRLCSNAPGQSLIAPALAQRESTKEMLVPGGRVYEQRECIYRMLNDIPGISAVRPQAAFYIFPKIDVKRFNIHDDELFALDLLKQEKILITHGRGFHWINPDHFRIVYLPQVDVLTAACEKMKHFFEHYQQA